jgi:hypothetical protein
MARLTSEELQLAGIFAAAIGATAAARAAIFGQRVAAANARRLAAAERRLTRIDLVSETLLEVTLARDQQTYLDGSVAFIAATAMARPYVRDATREAFAAISEAMMELINQPSTAEAWAEFPLLPGDVTGAVWTSLAAELASDVPKKGDS